MTSLIKYTTSEAEYDAQGYGTWTLYADGATIGTIEENERYYIPVRINGLGVPIAKLAPCSFRDSAIRSIIDVFEA